MAEQQRPVENAPGVQDAPDWGSVGATEDEVIRDDDAITPEVTDMGLDERGRDQPNGRDFGRGDMPEQTAVGDTADTGGTPDVPHGERPADAAAHRRERGVQALGSAAPEHDVVAAPAVEPAGAHAWPLPAGGAPTVTGEPDSSQRAGADQGGGPEAGPPDMPDVPGRTP